MYVADVIQRQLVYSYYWSVDMIQKSTEISTRLIISQMLLLLWLHHIPIEIQIFTV